VKPEPFVDAQQRFSITADDYQRYRPSYPPELVDWVLQLAPLERAARVLDLGCGTGITTRLFAQRGLCVIGLDPNQEMLAKASSGQLPAGIGLIRCAAEAIALRCASVELVISGQAFHWFDVPATCAQLERVVRPGAWSCAFWNSRTSTGLSAEYDVLLRSFSSEYARLQNARTTLDDLRETLVGREVREERFANRQVLRREELQGRARSSSYVAHGVADTAGFERALDQLFERNVSDGCVVLEYETSVLAWS
jgi:SAM-dependent methyltransferase